MSTRENGPQFTFKTNICPYKPKFYYLNAGCINHTGVLSRWDERLKDYFLIISFCNVVLYLGNYSCNFYS